MESDAEAFGIEVSCGWFTYCFHASNFDKDDSLNLIFYYMVESPNPKPMFADEQEVMDGL